MLQFRDITADRGEGVDQSRDLGLQLLDAIAGLLGRTGELGLRRRPRFVIALRHGRNDIGREQFLLQPADHARFERGGANAPAIIASPGLAMGGACPAILGHNGIGAAACGTVHQARQQVLRPFQLVHRYAGGCFLATLDLQPRCLVDDAQALVPRLHAIADVIRPGNPTPRFRIADHLHAIVDDSAGISGVMQNAVGAAAAAGQGGCPP